MFVLFFFFAKPAFASSVVLNEIMAKPDDEIEWIELYNATTNTIDLTGWKIKDGNTSTSDDLNLSGEITAGGLLVFEHNKGWLNDSSTETVNLLNGDAVIDSYQFNGTTQGKTFARVPDGGDWIDNITPTKNSTNGNLAASPTPTPIPSPSPSPQNTFQITNPPTAINSDQSFNITINLKVPALPSQKIYLKGAFKKTDSTNYFGLTKVSGKWIKNGESYNEQLQIETNTSGEWNGSIDVMPDVSDSGYAQTNSYYFKVAYYTQDGSGPNWSNQATITINHIHNQSSPTPSPSPTTSPSTTPDEDLEDLAYDDIATDSYEIDEDLYSDSYTQSSSSSEVEGIAFQNSSRPKSANKFPFSLLLIIPGIIFLVAAGFWYLRIRKNQLQS